MRKSGLPGNISAVFAKCSPVDLSSADWVPVNNWCTGLLMSGSGDLKVDMQYGGTMTIPVTVASGDHFVLDGYLISKVYKTGTTVSVIAALY